MEVYLACCQTQALIKVSLLFCVYSTDMLKCLLNTYALGEYLSEKQIYDLLQFLCIHGNGMISKSNRNPKEKYNFALQFCRKCRI